MGNPFRNALSENFKLQKVRGQFSPIIINSIVVDLTNVYKFGENLFFPLFYLKTRDKHFLGITIAKQSSDIVNILAKQFLKQYSGTFTPKKQLKILEYHFPNDNHHLKLLVLVEWTEIEDHNTLIQILTETQKNFRLFLHQKLTAL